MKSKKKLFVLSIYKKDLIEAEFTNITDCPIARALKRKGASFGFHQGGVGPFYADFTHKGKTMRMYGEKFKALSNRVNFMTSGHTLSKAISARLYAEIVEDKKIKK